MKRYKPLAVGLAIVLAAIFFALQPLPKVANAQLAGIVLQKYQSGRVATGGAATITLTKTGFACSFYDEDATDSISLQFNGASNNTLRLAPKQAYSTDSSTIPIGVNSFTHTAVANTPTLNWSCWEMD